MAKRVLSIVIGTQVTQICEVSYKKKNNNKGIRVYKSLSFPTPENTIEDGYIRDKDTFSETLRFHIRAGKFKSDKVIFSVSSSKIANREVIIPPVKDNKIMDVIRMGASEYFPIDIKEYVLSYSILEKKTSLRKIKVLEKKLAEQEKKLAKLLEKQNKTASKKNKKASKKANKKSKKASRKNKTDNSLSPMSKIAIDSSSQIKVDSNSQIKEDYLLDEMNIKDEKILAKKERMKRHLRLSVYAMPSTLVKNYYSFASMMRLDIVAIDYYGNSSYQIIKRQVNQGTNVVLQINEYNTIISILRDEVLILQRTVNYGISVLAEALLEQGYYKAESESEALELLMKDNLLTLERKEETLSLDSTWTKGEAAAANEFRQAFRPQQSQEDNEEWEARKYIIDSLQLLTNSVTRMIDYYKVNNKNLQIEAIYLSGIGIQVKGIENIFTSEIGVASIKIEKLSTISSRKRAAAYRKNPSEFMACIGAVIKPVDFVPRELIERKEKRSAVIGSTILIIACFSGAAILSYTSYTDYLSAKKNLDMVSSELVAMSSTGSVQEDYDKEKLELSNLQVLEGMTSNENDKINDIIEELEKKLPTNMVIHAMQFSETGISMSVSVSDDNNGPKALAAKVLLQLKTIEYFEKVDISELSVTNEDVIPQVSFSISCTYFGNAEIETTVEQEANVNEDEEVKQ